MLFSLSPIQIQRIRSRDPSAGVLLEKLLSAPGVVFATLLICNTLTNFTIAGLGYLLFDTLIPGKGAMVSIPLITLALLLFGSMKGIVNKKSLICTLCLIISMLSLHARPEGWFDGQAERVEPGSFITGNGGDGGVMPLTASSPMVVASDDSDLVELARGLQHNPVRIFNHVRDNIAYTPYFGLLKGAQQTLLERSGNDFDQATLLFRLLELSGYSPVYGYGVMVIPFFNDQRYDIASWLKTLHNFSAIDTILANGGIPFGYHGYYDYTVNRVWVEVVIDGITYKLDPAFKRHYASAGLDIRSIIGYSRSDLLSAAGGTIADSYVQNLNQANLFTYLDGVATNLHAILKRDYNDISMDELLNDVGIIPEPVTELPMSLRFPVSNTGTWTTIPAEYYHIVSITNETLTVTLKTSDVAGHRLSVTYAPAETLWLDDEPIASAPEPPQGKYSTLTIAIDHPYAANNGTFADQTVTYPLKREGTYAIVHGFGGSETGFPLDRRRRKMESYIEQELALTSREVQTESLNLVGQGWMEQTAMQERLLNRLAGVRRIIHHRFGLAAITSPLSRHCSRDTQRTTFRRYPILRIAEVLLFCQRMATSHSVNGMDAGILATVRRAPAAV